MHSHEQSKKEHKEAQNEEHISQNNAQRDLFVVKESEIHNKGVFAACDISKGTKIIEYVGEIISKKEGDDRADEQVEQNKQNPDNGAVYIFELDDEHDIDGNVEYNTAKWINHSCDPNCEIDITNGHIWIISKRDIKRGEELTYNYGYDFDEEENHVCKCGAANCVGFIVHEDSWPKLIELKERLEREKLEKEKNIDEKKE